MKYPKNKMSSTKIVIKHPAGRYTWHHTGSHRSEIEIEKYNADNSLVVLRVIEAAPGAIIAKPVRFESQAYRSQPSGSPGVMASGEIDMGPQRITLSTGQRLTLPGEWPATVNLTPLSTGERANTHCK